MLRLPGSELKKKSSAESTDRIENIQEYMLENPEYGV